MSLRAAIGYTALVVLIAVGLYAFATLPASIPTSFGFDGRPQAWGSKLTILMLPAAGLLAFVLISIVQATKPRANLPFRVPEGRDEAVQAAFYAGTADLKAFLMCGFLALTIVMIASSRGALSPAFLPVMGVFVVALVGIVAGMLVRAWRVAFAP